MARPKRTISFTVGVFGIPARIDAEGNVRIKVNVRTDQSRQLDLAKLDSSSTVLLVDCPGGAIGHEDVAIDDAALAREIAEETGGMHHDFQGRIPPSVRSPYQGC